MAEHQRKAHLVAEACALASAVVLIFVSYGLPQDTGWMIGAAGIGVVVVDCLFILSWKIDNRPQWMWSLHVFAEILGVACGMFLIYLALPLLGHWPIRALFVFCTGAAMCLIDGWFVLTWLTPAPVKAQLTIRPK